LRHGGAGASAYQPEVALEITGLHQVCQHQLRQYGVSRSVSRLAATIPFWCAGVSSTACAPLPRSCLNWQGVDPPCPQLLTATQRARILHCRATNAAGTEDPSEQGERLRNPGDDDHLGRINLGFRRLRANQRATATRKASDPRGSPYARSAVENSASTARSVRSQALRGKR
jgi:hypothetical protein